MRQLRCKKTASFCLSDLITRYKEQLSSAYQPGLLPYPPKLDPRVPLSTLPPFLLHKSSTNQESNIAASEKQGCSSHVIIGNTGSVLPTYIISAELLASSRVRFAVLTASRRPCSTNFGASSSILSTVHTLKSY
ncbi:unnamed protein product [Malus baccata var. baccata]